MKGGGTKCQTLGWWQMNEVVLKPEKKNQEFFFVVKKRLKYQVPDMNMIAQLN